MNAAALIRNLILVYLVENTYSLSGETYHPMWFAALLSIFLCKFRVPLERIMAPL